MVHVPILRAGKAYRSVETLGLTHVSTGEVVAEVSQANRGLIHRDLREAARNRRALREVPVRELLEMGRRAARLLVEEELPLDDDTRQSPDDFVRQQSSTTGLPQGMCRANMEKNRFVLAEMETVLGGLTRGLDPAVLDRGHGEEDGRTVSYLCQSETLGAVLPSNSPGVHSLWLPALPLQVPLILKPGSREPWTPMRIARAFQAAGVPPEAVSLYPSDHGGAAEILLGCGRSMLFGDESTLRPWKDDLRVQLHGPGWSKVIVGEDRIDDWESVVDLMATSIGLNGGRSCINASAVWVPAHADDIAEALARRFAGVRALPLDDPEAQIAAFSDPRVAQAISGFIDRLLEVPGAEDVSARLRGGGRLAEVDGCTFLLPTVIRCTDPSHPLTRSEFLFPFASVVEVPQDRLLSSIGPTLVATAVTGDAAFQSDLMACGDIDRLNLGEVPTCTVSWDQPHEGNLFEHLYRRRSFQAAPGAGVTVGGRA
jgi:acyl-CoA reductase-like NAD-dependent aldehyde dehydrogenase